jgi:hypothetical protein
VLTRDEAIDRLNAVFVVLATVRCPHFIAGAQTLRATLKLPAKDAKKLRRKKGVVLISFTPKGGLQRTVTKTIRL